MKKIRIGSREKEILKLIGLGVLFTASLVVPNLPLALKPFIENKYKKSNFKKQLKNLEDKNLIILGGDKIKLSPKGEKLFAQIQVEDLKIKKTKWDKIWRVVAYDIPNFRKYERDYFREKLISLGFKKIQKSIWVLPYKCREEIMVLAHTLKISPYVIYLTTRHIPQQKEMIKKFHLNSKRHSH